MPEDTDAVQAVARMRGGRTDRELVAVVGMGCVMPDAPDVETFWKNIQQGKSSIREVPPDRWDPALFYSDDRNDAEKTYTKIGAFVDEVPFNGIEFRIPPKVAQTLDGVQKMAILATAQALKDSGYDQKEFDRSRCAVILGQAMGGEIQRATSTRVQVPTFLKALSETDAFRGLPADQQRTIQEQFGTRARDYYPAITEDTMPGELANVVSGRIANVFNLSGANYTTDAACASSLAAIDAAVKSLQEGEYDMVITGGADRSMDIATYVKFCRIGALSATGSYPFDARADGFVMGEGAGILILKRLSDALRDGDKVYAVVRGVGSSSDGKGKGITAPNIEGQIKAIRRAFDHADIDPATVELVECHGTSTRVGDVVEVDALSKIWSESTAPRSVAIGSVKSQIGHLKSAAGAAGLIKSALALKEKTLPPSINFETPNPKIDWDNLPFYVNTEAKDWPDSEDDEPRRAAVSSFGFGGTNFHVILEEYVPGQTTPTTEDETMPQTAPDSDGGTKTPVTDVIMKRTSRETTVPEEPPAPAASTDVLVLGAPTQEAVLAKVEETKDLVASDRVTDANFADFCFQTSNANVGKTVRVAIAATDPGDLVKKLEQAPTAVKEPKKRIAFAARGIYVGEGPRKGKLGMLFPGQGSQYTDMLRDMATRYERVRQTYAEADRVMTPFLGDPLTKFIFLDEANGVDREAAEESLRRTEICQPAMLAADLALYRLLGDHGVDPELVAGHSLGEYGALVAAGVLSLEDALVAVSARGREMANVHVPDLGKMASVNADAETVAKHLESVDGYVIPANKNCKVQTVIAGASRAVDHAVEMFNKEGIQAQHINVSAAFHSEIVAPAREPFANVLRKIDIQAPKVPILTNVTADYYPSDGDVKDAVIDILTRQIAAPVEWQKQIRRMFGDGARVFIEVGPKRTLTAFCANVLEGEQFFAAATNHPKKGGLWHFNDALALLAAWGYPVRFPDPLDAETTTAGFRAGQQRYTPPADSARTTATAPTPSTAPKTSANGRDGQPETEASEIATRVQELGLNLDRLLITGVGLGTPGRDKPVFSDDNIDRMLEGRNHIESLDESTRQGMVDKNIVRLVKSATGDHRFETIHDLNKVLHLMGQSGDFDLAREFGIDQELLDALDVSSALAIASGIEALRDAGIPLIQSMVKTTTGKFLPGGWVLPVPLQEETGVVFASAFPGHVRLVETISDYFASKNAGASFDELADIYAEAIQTVRDTEVRRKLTDWFTRHVGSVQDEPSKDDVFEFNRRFLFHVLSMGHSQLAQLIKAKGPNTQVNSACSSTTMALSVAEDWIRTGRCKRVLVVGGDDITQEPANEWFGAGFLAAGAATTEKKVEEAALPFDRRRHGMIVGMGGVGLVLEAEQEVKDRGQEGIVEVIANVVANSAFHGSRLDTDHVATVMDRLMDTVEERLGVGRSEIAKELLFMSHETYTPARGGSAAAEILALRRAFEDDANQVVVSNTKGFTGHPMGASIEDAIAVKSLQRGRVPPIANLKEPDPELGDLNLSQGGEYDVKYALRLSAGFGSQVGMTFLKLRSRDEKRIVDPAKYEAWLSAMSGQKNPEIEVVNRTLRVKSTIERPMKAAEAPTRPAAPKEPTAPEPAPAPTPATPTPATTTEASPEEIRDRMLDLFAEKTGYPKDMLEPDLDLEADLGIDTVKQAELFGELREHYGLPQEEGLQLKDYPTINKIVDYIVSRLGETEASTEPTPEPATETAQPTPEPATETTEPADPEPSPTPTATAGGNGGATPTDKAEALATVTQLVAEKTGYPADLLEPDLDLEADLGIDTVKQAEIFGEVRERFGIAPVEGVQISDYPTLDRVAQFVVEHASGNGASPEPTPTTQKTPEPTPEVADRAPPARPDPEITQRYVVRYANLDATGEPAHDGVQDQRLLVYAPEEPDAVATALAEAGATVEPVGTLPASLDEAQDAVAGWRKQGDVDGVVLVLPDPAEDADPLPQEGDAWIRGVFHLVKALLADDQTLRTLAVVTALGGDFGVSRETPVDPTHGAVAGFAKATARELPEARVKVLDVAPGTAASTRIKILVQELGRTDPPVEIGTRDGRGTLRLVPEETVEEETGLELGGDDVLLVPGGAQGITSEIVKALAREYQCNFILLGRTQLVDDVERLAELSEDELAEKKQEIIQAMKERGEKPTPVAVEKEFSKITKSVEAHRTVTACQAAGGDALYVPGDVLKAEDVANAVDLGTKLFGPVTGIIHAAGVEHSKQIVDKTPESFARVYDVKIKGARNLLAATTDQPIASFLTFASVAGRFGNAGQVDYSAANDALAKLSLRLRQQRGDEFAATTIDWSAWADKGMATRGSIMTVLESLGVEPIPLNEGVARFLDEIAHGTRDAEVVVAAEMGQLAEGGSVAPGDTERDRSANGGSDGPTEASKPVARRRGDGGQQVLVVEKPKDSAEAGGLLSEVTEESETRVSARLHLDADDDPYLDDHAIDGTPYFPGVLGVEAFVQAAARLAGPGQRFVGVRDMEYRLPLKLLRRRPTDATIACQVTDRDDGRTEVECRLESQFVNAEGQALGAPKLHFSGTVLFSDRAPADAKNADVPEGTRSLDAGQVYEQFFHGPSFQVLAGLEIPDDEAVAVGRYAWPSADPMGSRAKADSLVTAPRVRELAFQTAGGHGIFQHEQMALPRRIGRSRFYGTPEPGENVVAVATFKRSGDGVGVYDVVVQTDGGRVLETLTDYEMIHTDTAPAQASEAADVATYRARWGHDLPVPLDGAKAVLVNDDEIRELGVSPESALTEGERTDQQRYRNDQRAREFFLGRLAAKEAVALLLDRPVKEARGVEIRRLETGRPEVQSQKGKDVLVTISHQGPYAVALAVRGGQHVKNVGVDFDRIEPKSTGFETESLTGDEIALLDAHEESGGDRAEMQLRLWTVKEAILKALGQGFALSLKSVRVTAFDGDDVSVELDESARACLDDFDAEGLHVESWTRDNYAYALAWLH